MRNDMFQLENVAAFNATSDLIACFNGKRKTKSYCIRIYDIFFFRFRFLLFSFLAKQLRFTLLLSTMVNK